MSFNESIHTTTYQLHGEDVKVHAIQTGSISVKNNFKTKKGAGPFTKLNILLGQQYAPFMPIWTWVIEHPEGIIVVDTGEIEASDTQEFYANESRGAKFNLWAMANKRIIQKEDELNNQLAKINIKPGQVSKVILTHLHCDHTDGLRFFPSNEIIVHESEYKYPYGNLPTTYPKWFKPTLINFSKYDLPFFKDAYAITQSENLWMVPTPGHTNNHCGILFITDEEHLLIAGDASYDQNQLVSNIFPGAHINYKKSQETYSTIKKYASHFPTIYLPAHDINSANRLLNKEPL